MLILQRSHANVTNIFAINVRVLMLFCKSVHKWWHPNGNFLKFSWRMCFHNSANFASKKVLKGSISELPASPLLPTWRDDISKSSQECCEKAIRTFPTRPKDVKTFQPFSTHASPFEKVGCVDGLERLSMQTVFMTFINSSKEFRKRSRSITKNTS